MHVRELFDLTGRVALVTGGSRGLGLQLAEALGELGARVALVARNRDELEAARAHLAARGADVACYAADLGDPGCVPGLVSRILDEQARVDILVNNAGTGWGAPAEEHPLEAWRRVLDLNLTAVFALTQEVARRAMIPRRGGRIINMASIAGLQATPPAVMRGAAYHASKGGLVNLTRALAVEWGPHGITVNAIAPGFFPTKMSKGVIGQAEQAILAVTPLGRLGGDDDLKGAVALLASEAGRYITGHVLSVDGGMAAL